MNSMVRKLTITVDEDVYVGLKAKVGARRISRFLNDLAKPLVSEAALLEGYRELAADADAEREAAEWADALLPDSLGDGV
jgi:predicted CopG family antitoxin